MAGGGEQHDDGRRRGRMRSFVIGGVIGASAVAAAPATCDGAAPADPSRRASPRSRARPATASCSSGSAATGRSRASSRVGALDRARLTSASPIPSERPTSSARDRRGRGRAPASRWARGCGGRGTGRRRAPRTAPRGRGARRSISRRGWRLLRSLASRTQTPRPSGAAPLEHPERETVVGARDAPSWGMSRLRSQAPRKSGS